MKRRIGIVIAVAFLGLPSRAQVQLVNNIQIKVGPLGDTREAVAWKYIAQTYDAGSERELKEKLAEKMKEQGRAATPPYYDFQRVEVNGVSTTDETSQAMPELFDRQYKVSNMNEPDRPASRIGGIVHKGWGLTKDLWSAAFSMNGELSSHEKESLKELHEDANGYARRVSVNEMVAHSWGSEIVYKGILSGYIVPPRKLIIVGVPEDNEEKWRMLAKYTGIEVHVIGFKTDKARAFGSLASDLPRGLPTDSAALESIWQKQCAARNERDCADPGEFDRRKFDYDINVPAIHYPDETVDHFHIRSLDHDRLWYYEYLYKHGLLRTTVSQLAAPQNAFLDQKMKDVIGEAMGEAEHLIDEARSQAGEQPPPPAGEVSPADGRGRRTARSGLGIPAPSAAIAAASAHAPATSRAGVPVASATPQARLPSASATPQARLPAASATPPVLDAHKLADVAARACSRSLTGADQEIILHFYYGVPNSAAVSEELSGCTKIVYDRLVQMIRSRDDQHLLSLEYIQSLGVAASTPAPAPSYRPRRRDEDDGPSRSGGGRVCGPSENGNPAWCTQ